MAFGDKTFTAAGGAVQDILGGEATAAGLRLKAQGDVVEGQNYSDAADLATQNEKFAEVSTAVKQTAADRAIYQSLGSTSAEIAGSNFGDTGTSLDLLRSSAQQGSIQKQLIGEQGGITEAGYTEQATAYKKLASYASFAADAENNAADTAETNGEITGGIKGLAAIASVFA